MYGTPTRCSTSARVSCPRSRRRSRATTTRSTCSPDSSCSRVPRARKLSPIRTSGSTPNRYAQIVRKVADALGRPHAAAALLAQLKQLDREYRTGLAHCRRHAIVTSHAAFGYLASATGSSRPVTGIDAGGRAEREGARSAGRTRCAHGRDDRLLRDARLAEARRDGRARDRREDGCARPARGTDEGRERPRRRLLHGHAREPRRAAEGARMPLAVELRDVSFAYAAGRPCSRDVDLRSSGRVRRRSPARTAAARRH